jgi:prepilin-type N-terminal cleavage/methylation domain-containing protein/prepilin-type processing-associated H-X9-DG protein
MVNPEIDCGDAHRPRARRSTSGFTLVELLVVVAIIALLLGILLPALGMARAATQSAMCMSNLRQLGIANLTYATEHRHLVPFSQFDPTITNMSGGKGVNVRWCWSDDTPGDPQTAFRNGLLSPYLDDSTDIAGCPAFETPSNVVDFYRQYGLAYPVAVDYGYNGLLLGEKHANFYSSDSSVEGYRMWVGYRPEQIDRPSTTVMFGDAAQFMLGQVVPNPTISPTIAVNLPDGRPRATVEATAHARHPNEHVNIAWVDGHSSSEPVQFYSDQPVGQRDAGMGFFAPATGEQRSNEWVFVK